jgi:hypothetical protein
MYFGRITFETSFMKEEYHTPKKGNHHALVAINSSLDSWIIDSRASHHMAAKEEVFTSLSSCFGPPILMGDDTPIAIAGEGRVELPNGSFENVLHVPNLSIDLLSVYQITQTCKRVESTSDLVIVLDMHDSSIIAVVGLDHKSWLYKFTKFIDYDSSLLLTHDNESSRVWHERFGHLNFRHMQQLSKQGMVKGLPDIQFSEGVCEGCILGKHPEENFEKGKARRASSSLELVHSDLMGAFPHPSISKARYVLTFIDDYSCYTWVYFLRQKSEVFEHLKDFKALVETQNGKKIKILCRDNRGEYIYKDVHNICHETGIQLQNTVPYTPQQNGVVEINNRSLKEMTSCMLHARSLPSKLWAEALNCATYIQNRAPHRSVEDRTPFEAWTGDKLDVTHLCIFGSRAWAHIPFEKRKALDPQSTPFIFMGYPDDVKGYRLIYPSTDWLIIERTV